jgi:hypothetical protein
MFGFRWLALLGAMLATCCDDTRPVYPLGAYEDAADAGAAGAAGAPEAGQSAGGAGGRTADAG